MLQKYLIFFIIKAPPGGGAVLYKSTPPRCDTIKPYTGGKNADIGKILPMQGFFVLCRTIMVSQAGLKVKKKMAKKNIIS